MADYAKDSEKQTALRRQIENHPIWQYPPEERLQHNREWQSLYLLVFEFKEFLQKLENRLNNAGYDTGYLKQDEDAMLEARSHPPAENCETNWIPWPLPNRCARRLPGMMQAPEKSLWHILIRSTPTPCTNL